MIKRVLKWSDLYLAQTKSLVARARQDGIEHAVWFPTSRPAPDLISSTTTRRNECKKFIYLGHVRSEKGIREIIEACERFNANDTSVKVHIYGTLRHDMTEQDFEGLRAVKYCGMIEPQEVYSVLSDYDALLFPSYYQGEGYPGVIIEAFAAGLPVVCSRWLALPEIVDETCGILIEPKNSQALYDAMNQLTEDPEMYTRLCEGALQKSQEFSSEYWAERFVQSCKNFTCRRK